VTFVQITEKGNGTRIEAILHIVSKFQFDGACFQRGASANVGVSTYTLSAYPTQKLRD